MWSSHMRICSPVQILSRIAGLRRAYAHGFASAGDVAAEGATACRDDRLPADNVENAILDSLLDQYRDLDLFDRAIAAAHAATTDDRPGIEQQLASIDRQLRETNAALERYLRAFETGTMPDHACAPRVEHLSARRQQFTVHRTELAARLDALNHQRPTRPVLEAVGDTVRHVLTTGNRTVVKQLLSELITRIDVHPQRRVQPTLRIPSNRTQTPDQQHGRALRTSVRMASQNVDLLASDLRDRPAVLNHQPSRFLTELGLELLILSSHHYPSFQNVILEDPQSGRIKAPHRRPSHRTVAQRRRVPQPRRTPLEPHVSHQDPAQPRLRRPDPVPRHPPRRTPHS
jgi:hypothetical protein